MHRIKAGFLTHEETHSGQCTLRENHPVFSAMREDQLFLWTQKFHVMFAGDRPSTQRSEADRASFARQARARAADLRVQLDAASPCRCVSKEESGSRRRIRLHAMMRLGNLDVPVRPEHLSRP